MWAACERETNVALGKLQHFCGIQSGSIGQIMREFAGI
jgi:hypothetical protein